MALLQPTATAAAAEDGACDGDRTTWSRSAAFLWLFALIWVLLYVAHVALPLIQSGAAIISTAKFERLVSSTMFEPQDRVRVLFFGNSKALSGIRPLEFDSAFQPGVRSYNLGLPGEPHFLPILEDALRAGNVPTHVALTVAWDDDDKRRGLLSALQDDAAIGDALLPFRTFPRDVALFVFNSRLHLLREARVAAAERDTMVAQRGWYFIRGQSHFPGDSLPDDYELPTDHPNRFEARPIPRYSQDRDRLEHLAIRYGFEVLLVPSFLRKGEAAAPVPEDQARSSIVSSSARVRLIGPDYWVYPASSFSDPVHLNPPGASIYTRDLADLFRRSGIVD